jgi:phosphotriesterase-related protein
MMRISPNAGKVQTVLGLIDPEDLGITLCHEHLMLDMSGKFVEPTSASEKALAYEPVRMENLHWLHYHMANNRDNLRMLDEGLATKEALRYKYAGGKSIVDVTSIGLARDPRGLQRIARATDLNIIMGSSYYIDPSRPPELAGKSEEEIAEEITQEFAVGIGNTGVRPGLIGEIGCFHPLTESDRKVLRASARAQQHTGAPLTIHPGYAHGDSPFEIMEVIGEAGADLTRTVIWHMSLMFSLDVKAICRIAKAGCYISYDNFGRARGVFGGFGQLGTPDFAPVPHDGWWVDQIMQLIDQGYLNQILISHDICHKVRLHHYGGSGYDHILLYVLPLMRAKGMSEEHIHTLLVENPKRMLQFV